jgi:hypothetical protein
MVDSELSYSRVPALTKDAKAHPFRPERDGIVITPLRRAKFGLRVHSAKDGSDELVLILTCRWGAGLVRTFLQEPPPGRPEGNHP